VAFFEKARMGFLNDARNNLVIMFVEQMCIGESRRPGYVHLAAEGTHSLDQESFSSASGRRDGCSNAGSTAAAYDDIICFAVTAHY
jgi:hypothetical protein